MGPVPGSGATASGRRVVTRSWPRRPATRRRRPGHAPRRRRFTVWRRRGWRCAGAGRISTFPPSGRTRASTSAPSAPWISMSRMVRAPAGSVPRGGTGQGRPAANVARTPGSGSSRPSGEITASVRTRPPRESRTWSLRKERIATWAVPARRARAGPPGRTSRSVYQRPSSSTKCVTTPPRSAGPITGSRQTPYRRSGPSGRSFLRTVPISAGSVSPLRKRCVTRRSSRSAAVSAVRVCGPCGSRSSRSRRTTSRAAASARWRSARRAVWAARSSSD